MTPSWLWSPVSLVYLITAVSALALFHQPVPCHCPVAGLYHFWSALIPVLAQLRKSGAATRLSVVPRALRRAGSWQLGRGRECLLEGGQEPDAVRQGTGSPAGPAGGHDRGPGPGPADRGQLVVVGGRR